MKANDMRSLAADELSTRIGGWEEELFRARCNQVIGQVGDTSQIKKLRREIARAKTLILEMNRDAAKSA